MINFSSLTKWLFLVSTKADQDHTIRVLKKKIISDSIGPESEPEPMQLPIEELIEKKTAVPFEHGDTVCLFGGCWGIPHLMQSVAKQKEEKNLKVITLMYDLIPVLHPQFFDVGGQKLFVNYAFQAIRISDKIIAISNNTKKDIEAECKKSDLKSPPIIVVRLGDDVQPKKSCAQATNLTFTDPYILCVGTIEIRKNHILIYQAYKYLIEKYGATDKLPDMVIVGGKAWLTDDIYFQMSNDPQTSNKIHFITNCSDAELLSLYNGCLFTVYPSVYEGWGLPIAESLKYGKFCLASQTSSMPEIAGDLIEYFSPFDSSHFAELIWEYSTNPDMLAAKEEKILSDFKITEWKNSARFILMESIFGN